MAQAGRRVTKASRCEIRPVGTIGCMSDLSLRADELFRRITQLRDHL